MKGMFIEVILGQQGAHAECKVRAHPPARWIALGGICAKSTAWGIWK
jgi:hypothetical protein